MRTERWTDLDEWGGLHGKVSIQNQGNFSGRQCDTAYVLYVHMYILCLLMYINLTWRPRFKNHTSLASLYYIIWRYSPKCKCIRVYGGQRLKLIEWSAPISGNWYLMEFLILLAGLSFGIGRPWVISRLTLGYIAYKMVVILDLVLVQVYTVMLVYIPTNI